MHLQLNHNFESSGFFLVQSDHHVLFPLCAQDVHEILLETRCSRNNESVFPSVFLGGGGLKI